jgi:hypothetical protein
LHKTIMALPTKQIAELKGFVGLLKAQPELLHKSELSFFREYLTGMGATIPPKVEV